MRYEVACVQTLLVYRNRIELNGKLKVHSTWSEFSVFHSTQFDSGKLVEFIIYNLTQLDMKGKLQFSAGVAEVAKRVPDPLS